MQNVMLHEKMDTTARNIFSRDKRHENRHDIINKKSIVIKRKERNNLKREKLELQNMAEPKPG